MTEIEKIVNEALYDMFTHGEIGSSANVTDKIVEDCLSKVKKFNISGVGFALPRPLEAWNEAQKLDVADYIDWHLEKEKSGN
jgi:hypothetical protein